MAWFEFNQNNTGGSFDVNERVCHRVLIEAETAVEANRIAVDMGIYFDGVSTGMDCGCCGDRWYEADGEGVTYPHTYGWWRESDLVFSTPEEHMQYLADDYGWTSPDVRIFYADGQRVSEVFSKKRSAA